MLDDAWRQQMIREVGIEASNYDSIKVVIEDADNEIAVLHLHQFHEG